MIRFLLFCTLVILSSCSSGSHVMTLESFYEVPIGSSVPEMVAMSGEPYAVHKKPEGAEEYEYIERFKVGGRNIQERHYFFLVKDGKVVSKRVEQSSPSPIYFDSYEMQTTQNRGGAS